MALIPFVEEDYLSVARSRTTEQFKKDSAPVFDRYLQLLLSAQIELQDVFKQLLQMRDLDSAEGEQLNVIGRIVGQDRVLINADLYTFFGFQGALKAGTFGEFGNNLLGSRFLDYGQPTGGNITLDDETYRLFIRAKIYKNTTRSTPEEFIEVVNLIFGTTGTFLSENGNANATVYISRPLTDIEKGLLQYINSTDGYPSRLIPKTVGVGIGFGEYQSGNFFGFEGVPGAKGFGDYTGTTGYGLGYGLDYGDSNFGDGPPIWSQVADGSNLADGSTTANATATYSGTLSDGGYFATLY